MSFCISRSVENWPEMASNETAMFTLLSHPNLADILGDTDFDFENFYILDFLGPKFLAWAQLGPTHLGPAWAHPLGPGWGPPTWAQLGPYFPL